MNDKKNNEIIKEEPAAMKDIRIPENEYTELSDDDLEQVGGGGSAFVRHISEYELRK